MNRSLLAILGLAQLASSASAADAIDFRKQVRPILEVQCLKCHGPEKPKGGLNLTTRTMALKGGDSGTSLVPGDSAKSPLFVTTTLPDTDEKAMPPKGDRVPVVQQAVLKAWIEQGAVWPENIVLAQKKKVDFVKDIQPIFEFNCVPCHREGYDKGKLRMDVREELFKNPGLVRGDAAGSKIYTTTVLPADHDDLMPPKAKNGPLPTEKTDLIRDWIDQGADWPDGIILVPRKADEAGPQNEEQMVGEIHKKLLAGGGSVDPTTMQKYKETMPGSTVTIEMIPIPAGEFVMGSPEGEEGREADEGPQRKVQVDAFWMAKTETTWDEFEQFMYKDMEFASIQPGAANPYVDKVSDAVSRPTKPYVEMSFGMGKSGFPAISMTHFAALTYCKWLSAKTGHYYRLPTEAEWEYACRAGTKTKYYFGDDPKELENHAWYIENAESKYQKVGQKKPNPWGLHDMHGNVAEWVLDGYVADAYTKLPAANPWQPGFKEYPHIARGGSWDDEAGPLRSAAKRHSEPSWKMRDPQLPKSRWYLTDAQFLGFRVVRPAKVPPAEELQKIWTSFPVVK